eukprot:NODE_450_length_7272_cov_0.725613.p3 type:complete len:371 gc:universal NODE_450_length_7272_cov_0.725613:5103-3991(-)
MSYFAILKTQITSIFDTIATKLQEKQWNVEKDSARTLPERSTRGFASQPWRRNITKDNDDMQTIWSPKKRLVPRKEKGPVGTQFKQSQATCQNQPGNQNREQTHQQFQVNAPYTWVHRKRAANYVEKPNKRPKILFAGETSPGLGVKRTLEAEDYHNSAKNQAGVYKRRKYTDLPIHYISKHISELPTKIDPKSKGLATSRPRSKQKFVVIHKICDSVGTEDYIVLPNKHEQKSRIIKESDDKTLHNRDGNKLEDNEQEKTPKESPISLLKKEPHVVIDDPLLRNQLAALLNTVSSFAEKDYHVSNFRSKQEWDLMRTEILLKKMLKDEVEISEIRGKVFSEFILIDGFSKADDTNRLNAAFAIIQDFKH